VHAHSAATTTKAGSALGDALNKATNNIAGQIQTVPKSTAVSSKIQHIRPQKTQPAGAATAPGSASGISVSGASASAASTSAASASGGSASGGSMIVSIRGVRRNCGAASTGASNQGAGSPAGDASKSANCRTP